MVKNTKDISLRKIKRRKNLELELCQRFKGGDLFSFSELVKLHAELMKVVIEKYMQRGLTPTELLLYAKIGLLKAAHRYDESKMVSFRLYSIWWMRQCILKALQEQAKLEMIPELLISSLQELLQTFKNSNNITQPENLDFENAVHSELLELQKVAKTK